MNREEGGGGGEVEKKRGREGIRPGEINKKPRNTDERLTPKAPFCTTHARC